MHLVSAFSRLRVSGSLVARNISSSSVLWFKSSPVLCAEPLKKKKRMDPAILRAREERKKKKIEKQIRRLEKCTKQLKPLEECEIPLAITENEKLHRRSDVNVSEDIAEQRVLLAKKWAKYVRDQYCADIQMLDRVLYSQQRALDELQKESDELYQEAIKIDEFLLPFHSEGPAVTPPIENYHAPDGEYSDVSRKW